MKPKIRVNNKIRAFGTEDDKTGLIEINKKKHKGNNASAKRKWDSTKRK